MIEIEEGRPLVKEDDLFSFAMSIKACAQGLSGDKVDLDSRIFSDGRGSFDFTIYDYCGFEMIDMIRDFGDSLSVSWEGDGISVEDDNIMIWLVGCTRIT